MTKKPLILQTAQIEWRDGVAFATAFDDFYFSKKDALQESDYVFLQHNFLAERFAQLLDKTPEIDRPVESSESMLFAKRSVFRVAETGFGSGLNFLLCLQLWQTLYQQSLGDNKVYRPVQLHFISVEKHPMQLEDLLRVLSDYPQVAQLSELLGQAYPPLLPGWHDVYFLDGLVRLTLWFGDAQLGLAECDASSLVDAWLLDGFSPSKNSDMWHPKLYQQISRLSHSQTTFATFTAAGHVRRALEAIGFKVEKDVGYGKKREMCFGKMQHLRPNASKSPWFERKSFKNSDVAKNAIVVGAGLSGATTAYALAQAGWQVKVLERHAQPAQEASGNLAGTLHPLITVDWNLRSQFYQLGYSATQRWLAPWLQTNKVEGDLQGMVQLAATDTAFERLQEAVWRVPLPKNYATWLESLQASQTLATHTNYPAMFYPSSGWVYPTSVIQQCLAHPKVEFICDCEVDDFVKTEGGWQVQTSQGVMQAANLVFATGSLAEKIHQKLQLPIRAVKGQVTHLQADAVSADLAYPVTHKGYSSPTSTNVWVTGATFEAPDLSMEVSQAGHQHNLSSANEALPEWLSVDSTQLESHPAISGRIAFRPTTPDHLPIIGPVPNWDWVVQNYCQQSHTHAVYRYPKIEYQSGLYVNNGHGPRGLMSVFLAAEWLLAEMEGRDLPVSKSLYAACHPARFRIREWRSGKIRAME